MSEPNLRRFQATPSRTMPVALALRRWWNSRPSSPAAAVAGTHTRRRSRPLGPVHGPLRLRGLSLTEGSASTCRKAPGPAWTRTSKHPRTAPRGRAEAAPGRRVETRVRGASGTLPPASGPLGSGQNSGVLPLLGRHLRDRGSVKKRSRGRDNEGSPAERPSPVSCTPFRRSESRRARRVGEAVVQD
jgi:hypothetical protein